MHHVSSVKVGVLGQHSSAQLLQNLSTALPHVIKNIRENWDNVQSIHIKTSSSASLPIWTCRLDEEEGGRWDGLTRVLIPDNTDEEVERGKKRALESEPEEETVKKKKSDTITKRPTPVSQTMRLDPPSTEYAPSKGSKPTLSPAPIKPSKSTKERLAPENSKKLPTNKGPIKVKGKNPRAAAVDFLDAANLEDCPSASKSSVYKATTSRKSAELKPSSDAKQPVHEKPKPQGERPSETKTILKSSKKFQEGDVATNKKRVKFAIKHSDSKTKRDKALGLGKKVRSGGGKGVSAKDRVLGKKV